MMCRRFLAVAVAIFSLGILFVPATAAAWDPFGTVCSGPSGEQSAVCSNTNTSNPISGTDGIILDAANVISILAGAAAVIVLIIGGLRYVLANGDSSNITSAKNTVVYAIVGIVVIASARILIGFVLSKI